MANSSGEYKHLPEELLNDCDQFDEVEHDLDVLNVFQDQENSVIAAKDPIKCELDENCVICGKLNDETSVVVREEELRTLATFSDSRGDGNTGLFENVTQIRLHITCREKYTNRIVQKPEEPLKGEVEHDSDLISDYVEKCALCGELNDETSVLVPETGLRRLAHLSVLRNDDEKTKLFESVKQMHLHRKCRTNYIYARVALPRLNWPNECDRDDYTSKKYEGNCVFCGKLNDETSVLVPETGLRRLAQLSVLRNDDEKTKLFESVTQMHLHEKCRRNYIYARVALPRLTRPNECFRDDDTSNKYKGICVFCGKLNDITSLLEQETGLRKLAQLSVLRNDDEKTKLFESVTQLHLHRKCKLNYIYARVALSTWPEETPNECDRDDDILNKYYENCVLCGEMNDETSVLEQETQLRKLAQLSALNDDGKAKLFESVTQMRLHQKCKLNYINARVGAFNRTWPKKTLNECVRGEEIEDNSDVLDALEDPEISGVTDPVEYDEKICVICGDMNDETSKIVKEKGLRRLVKFSILRRDRKKKLFESLTQIRLHSKCRSYYINERSRTIRKAFAKEQLNECGLDKEDSDLDADCVICGEPQDETTTTVKERGLRTLTKFSILRGDGNRELFQNVTKLRLHSKCRSRYTLANSSGVYEPLPRGRPNECDQDRDTDLGSNFGNRSFKHDEETDEAFDFKTKCFICEKTTLKHAQSSYHVVKKSRVKDTVLMKSTNQKLIDRIKDVDLQAEGARYHPPCYARMLKPLKDHRVEEAMQIIFDHIDKSENEEQFSLAQLTGLLKGFVPDNRTILKRLSERYQDRMDVGSLNGNDEEEATTSVWNYFESNSDGSSARCAVCCASVPRPDMKQHLKARHPKLLTEVTLGSDPEASDSHDDVYTEIVYLEDEPNTKKEKSVVKKKPKPTTERTAARKRRISTSSDEEPLRETKAKTKAKEDDEIERFGKYVTCLLRKIPPEACMELQMDIVNLIMKKQLELKRNATSVLAGAGSKMAAAETAGNGNMEELKNSPSASSSYLIVTEDK